MIATRGLAVQNEIKAGVERAEKALAPDVVRIRYSIAPDWTGDESLFFRIVVTDEAAKEVLSHERAQNIKFQISEAVKAEELGLQTYFNFRTLSDQTKLQEAKWE